MLIIRNAAMAAAVLSLTACGGGGGGGGGDDRPVVTVPSTLQAPNTTKTYDVSSAIAQYDSASGIVGAEVAITQSGSTVTVTTDEAGRVSRVSIDILTNDDDTFASKTYSGITGVDEITVSELAAGIRAVDERGTGTTALIMAAPGLSYSAYGAWAYNAAPGDFRMGTFAGGNETPNSRVPTSGSATYRGITIGAGATGTEAFAFRGDATIVADFGANAVSTTFSSMVTQNISTGATGSLPTISGTGLIGSDPGGTFYETTLNANGYTGWSEGAFYGPNAEETAGAWIAEDATTRLIGSFGAER
jgi:hypothetical protein